MDKPRTQEHGQGSAYTCMLWNVRSGLPTVVTIYAEHQDRWIGRRCVVVPSSFEAPAEMFMKSDWQREEPRGQEKPEDLVPASGAGTSSRGAGALVAQRGFHPNTSTPAPSPNAPIPVSPPPPAAARPRKSYGFHP
jgi:hypothetical protein